MWERFTRSIQLVHSGLETTQPLLGKEDVDRSKHFCGFQQSSDYTSGKGIFA